MGLKIQKVKASFHQKVKCLMKKTTLPPPVDVLEILPELANAGRETIRLHPRQGEVTDLHASKIGGIFLWPSEEPWVTVPSKRTAMAEYMEYSEWKWDFPDGTHIELVPVLQLNKKDVPE